MSGLKMMRSQDGPKNPNTYWQRRARKRCSCGHHVRGPNHENGAAHQRGKGSGRAKKYG
jgi:hypothetical protein